MTDFSFDTAKGSINFFRTKGVPSRAIQSIKEQPVLDHATDLSKIVCVDSDGNRKHRDIGTKKQSDALTAFSEDMDGRLAVFAGAPVDTIACKYAASYLARHSLKYRANGEPTRGSVWINMHGQTYSELLTQLPSGPSLVIVSGIYKDMSTERFTTLRDLVTNLPNHTFIFVTAGANPYNIITERLNLSPDVMCFFKTNKIVMMG